jgi:hypothetical protein
MLLEDKLPAQNHEIYVQFSADHLHEVEAIRDACRSRNDYSLTEVYPLDHFDRAIYMTTPDKSKIELSMQSLTLKEDLIIN